MSGMFSEEFRSHIYNNLGDVLDLLSLCNALSTFAIYCCMSAQFRKVLPDSQIIPLKSKTFEGIPPCLSAHNTSSEVLAKAFALGRSPNGCKWQ